MYFFNVKGTKDILPFDFYLWDYIINIVKKKLFNYGYKFLNTPVLEYKNLFSQSLGNYSNLLQKEIYTFNLKNKVLCLRPESTTSVFRVFLKYNLYFNYKFNKFCYFCNIFRHDKPQLNRYREFYQIGLEILNGKDSVYDLDLILFCDDLFVYLNIRKYVSLNINSIGLNYNIYLYKIELIKFFIKNLRYFLIDKKYIFKIFKNPLLILDEKKNIFLFVLKNSPKLYNFLNFNSFKKFEKIKFLLKINKILFIFNKNLVRGLDYYNDFVFEWIDKFYNFNSLIGGGRYDFLSKKFFLKKICCVGLSIGLERILKIYENNKIYIIYEFDIILIYLDKKIYLKSFFLYQRMLNINLKCFLVYLNYFDLFSILNNLKSKFFIFIENNFLKYNILFLLYLEPFFNKKNYNIFIKKLNFTQIKKFFLLYKTRF